MKHIKTYLISIGISIITIIIGSFLINILNYYNLLNKNTYKALILLVFIISAIISSYKIGKKTEKKGYLKGLLFGIITTLIFLIITIINSKTLTSKTIIYYLAFIITSLISSTIGINNKKEISNKR